MRHSKKGAEVCERHGGILPGVKRVAEAKVAREEVRKQLGTLGFGSEPTEHEITEGLLEEIFWSKTQITWLRSRIQDIEPEALVWGISETADGFGEDSNFSKTIEKAGLNTWLVMYNSERKLYVEMVRNALAIGIEQRRIDIIERHVELMDKTLRAILDGFFRGLIKRGYAEEEIAEDWPAIMEEVVPAELERLSRAEPVE